MLDLGIGEAVRTLLGPEGMARCRATAWFSGTCAHCGDPLEAERTNLSVGDVDLRQQDDDKTRTAALRRAAQTGRLVGARVAVGGPPEQAV
ncbi:hypothetical protein [Streptomyces nanshensis]|uniref:Uncharacterized protein n=1 Tax=Streptomyces nanshensis TaxID=518642 RepID=A0A1E7L8P4_9ACTN|nr:hypothetical protein [Streptomyces nanshensis]OEV12471.1 hypothetical protein AN218_08130 [Streptomyces nanshensis]